MECIMGIALKDFVMMAADTSTVRNVGQMTILSDEESKIINLTDKMLMTAGGDSGDKTQFVNFVIKNVNLYNMRNHHALTCSQITHYTRRSLAEALRGSNPFQLKMLLGSCDQEDGPALYYIDWLGSLVKLKSHVACYGADVAVTILDRYYGNGELNVEEAYCLLGKCCAEIRKRYVMNYMRFQVKMINKEGIFPLPDIAFTRPLTGEDARETTF